MGREIELKRQLFHITAGTIIAILLIKEWITPIHLTILLAILISLFLLYLKIKIPLIHHLLVAMEREENMRTFPGLGATFFVLGITLTAWIFPPTIASASILILAWGDGIASLIGPYGKLPYINPKKTWEGILAAIVAGTATATTIVLFAQAFAGATIAMFIEGLDLKIGKWKIDDNLLVPLIAGLVMLLLGNFI
jgi:dolichol kinase